MASINDISRGKVMKFKGGLSVVTYFQHVNPGKGSSFVRVRLKDIATGKMIEQTMKSSEQVEFVEVDRPKVQFLYSDPTGFAFMHGETFEQVIVPRDMVGDDAGYLTEGLEVHVIMYEGQPLSIELPKKVTLEVTEAFDAAKGDTASGNVTKEVTLETGMKTRVPMFIKQGERIILNTETGEYAERA
ncbi:MAG: elongation factor P [bacterium]|nr:elongation factor P [bacterium]